MVDPNERLNKLQIRLDNLAKYEAAFKREIADIRNEIWQIKLGAADGKPETGPIPDQTGSATPQVDQTPPVTQKPVPTQPVDQTTPGTERPVPPTTAVPKPPLSAASSRQHEPNFAQNETKARFESNLEKFVGTYLISVVGILILVIGVGIGAKFAIDNNLISPLMRIVFGYVAGIALVGAAVQLKAKYESFSAVILSGGMTILYFITYFAYSYYSLISQTTAFALMVIFTIFTVAAAIIYNRQIIAHLGLVGGYAVPFLLSDGSGRILVLFSYIGIINLGILAVSVHKYWRSLFYSAFVFTWLIFSAFYSVRYSASEHFGLSLVFVCLFFAIFYATFLAYRLVHKQDFEIENIALIVFNAFIFYGFGYSILSHGGHAKYLGAFTLLNSVIHFGVAAFIHFWKLGGTNAFYLIVALVLTFVTIIVPVEADGNWITVLWLAMGLFLYATGRFKRIKIFEYFSLPLFALGCVGLLTIWEETAGLLGKGQIDGSQIPLLNGNFFTSLFAAFVFGASALVDRNKDRKSQITEDLQLFVKYLFPAAFTVILYNTFRLEIGLYFQNERTRTGVEKGSDSNQPYTVYNHALMYFSALWQLNYTFLFASLFTIFNIRKFRQASNGIIGIGAIAILVGLFCTAGLLVIEDLRWIYFASDSSAEFQRGPEYIWIRYACAFFAAGSLFVLYKQLHQKYISGLLPDGLSVGVFDLGVCSALFFYLMSELFNWTDILRIAEPTKLWLSLLWGIYGIILIVIGIIAKKKHLRIFAILLFGLTLAKLFLHDVADLDTISKTALFVSIGVMMLVASFLYNKYTKRIFGEGI